MIEMLTHLRQCFKPLVGGACGRTWVGAEQCRPEAWAVRGKASMPEAPLEWGGIATNVVAAIGSGVIYTKLNL